MARFKSPPQPLLHLLGAISKPDPPAKGNGAIGISNAASGSRAATAPSDKSLRNVRIALSVLTIVRRATPKVAKAATMSAGGRIARRAHRAVRNKQKRKRRHRLSLLRRRAKIHRANPAKAAANVVVAVAAESVASVIMANAARRRICRLQ